MIPTPRQHAPLRIAACAVVAVALLVPASGQASPYQEEQRRKQLEVLEELLSENVQEYVDERVTAEMRGNTSGSSGHAVGANGSLVVRVGSVTRAHGVFIDDYGVIFSIQIPQVGVLPRHFAENFRMGRAPRWQPGGPDRPEEAIERVTARMVAGQTKSMEQQLRALEALLRRQLEANEGDETVRRQLDQIQELRARFDRISVEAGVAEAPHEADPESTELEAIEESEAPAPEALEPEPESERTFLRRPSLMDSQLHISELLAESRQRTAQAVADATVETLANFGSVLKGLDDDDRISVVVVPSASFVREHHTGHGREEFVVSVRFGDIEDLDDGRIDRDEFRSRVQIHNRLGTPIGLSDGSG